MSEKWVQHKSGQGEKWQVDSYYDDHEMFWRVRTKPTIVDYVYRLPKSEYIECDPPEVWEECTREVMEISEKGSLLRYGNLIPTGVFGNERWAWRGDALVIERRKS